ncbi:hypothetical protein FXO38_26848 [Capsicum annuum]|nr:hypothetical protein FXO38_26848 [Capsicum annuum]KAF3662466.1 hypothetical protein FXO37_12437 [Capsicum annuum]
MAVPLFKNHSSKEIKGAGKVRLGRAHVEQVKNTEKTNYALNTLNYFNVIRGFRGRFQLHKPDCKAEHTFFEIQASLIVRVSRSEQHKQKVLRQAAENASNEQQS